MTCPWPAKKTRRESRSPSCSLYRFDAALMACLVARGPTRSSAS